MSYLLDTNVVSELRRSQPDKNVTAWVEQRPAGQLFISALTLGEIRKGVERLPASPKRVAIENWLELEVPEFFRGRVLSIDRPVAERWGRLLAMASRSLPAIDSLIAATALQHGLDLVTRNQRDFDFPGLKVIDPWQPSETTQKKRAQKRARKKS